MRRDKWKFVKTHRLCFKCLTASHDIDTCDAPDCDIEECGRKHHRVLHWKQATSSTSTPSDPASNEQPSAPASPAPPLAQPPRSAASDADATIAHVATPDEVTADSNENILLKVVPVKLCGPRGVIQTYAMLDDCAGVSMLDSSLADELGLHSERPSAVKFIDAFGLEVYQPDAPKVRVKIAGLDNTYYDISLRKSSKLKLPPQNLSPINQISCNKLSKIKDIVCKQRVVPRVLIGEDNYYLIAPLEIIHGSRNSPYGTRCRLGWCIHGYCSRARSSASQTYTEAESTGSARSGLKSMLVGRFGSTS
ncbi:uncharacterized protein LOC125229255 isoform X2 [Leguminivora glycinivorella]|uniref:uncharacterized protein LOC125229255 isoform X2 n=1 Tax=Leguminivora glycinivorella TaxID=1035111 RepID=UPI0020108851|nr:uncharacterized protein LOC125229255 isoform X2 [Leguminivora glycinivorella]